MIATLFEQFNISDADQQDMLAKMRSIGFKKGQTLEHPSSDERYIYFIKQGILRVYHYNEDEEINSYFAAENNFISAFSAIIGTKSEQYVAAIDDGLAMKLAAKDYNAAFDNINGWQKLGRHLAEENYLCMTDRLINFNHLNAKQKYNKFIVDFGHDISKRIPNYHIASYLGITPESLSRIKRK